MTKKLFSHMFLVMSVMLIAVLMSAEASGGTVISTVVPRNYTITFDIDGGGSVEYEDVLYKNGDMIQATEGTDVKFVLRADSQYKLKSVSFNGQDVTKQVSDGSIVIQNVQQDGTFVVTYTKIGSVIDSAKGDNSHIWLRIMLPVGSIVLFAIIVLQIKKSKHS